MSKITWKPDKIDAIFGILLIVFFLVPFSFEERFFLNIFYTEYSRGRPVYIWEPGYILPFFLALTGIWIYYILAPWNWTKIPIGIIIIFILFQPYLQFLFIKQDLTAFKYPSIGYYLSFLFLPIFVYGSYLKLRIKELEPL